MEEQFACLNQVPPFKHETSTGSKPTNRVMNKNFTTLPC